jgi:hypothetical protein
MRLIEIIGFIVMQKKQFTTWCLKVNLFTVRIRIKRKRKWKWKWKWILHFLNSSNFGFGF